MPEMNATTVIPTDLVTPLGAYLRLRPEDGAAFLLESVEHGRLGRHSFVGYGTRIVGFEEAEALDEPVVGYLGYDHIAKLEPTVAAARHRARTFPRAGSSSPTRSSSSTTSSGWPRSCAATRSRWRSGSTDR